MDQKQRLESILPMTGENSTTDNIESSKKMINNRIFNLRDFYNIHIDIENGWLTESNSRILRRRMHTHVFLSDFIEAYSNTKDIIYFNESFKIMRDWFTKYPVENKENVEELAYHPEGTAIRLLFWMKYYNQFFDLFDDEERKIFDNIITDTGKLLAQEDFYAGMTNHGLFQNMGLLAYVVYDDENFQDSDLFHLALDRIYAYVNEVFTSEGVHKEHSPSYHVLLVHNIKQILETFKLLGFKNEKINILKELFDKMEHYTINIVTPEFKLPNISDGTQFNLSTNNTYKNLFRSDQFKYVTSAGKEGEQPSPLINIYPESGYLIARDSWNKDATYFLFLASYHMHFHKHTDDLSFLLYKNGPIFIDAGPYSYDYNNPFTQYAYSQFAHSTLLINDRSLPRTDNKFDDVYISEHLVNNEEHSFMVEGINKRYESSEHTRKIEGNLKDEYFEITDTVTSDSFNQYKIIFQINGQLQVIHNGSVISIFKNNTKIAELEIIDSKGMNSLKSYTIENQEFPYVMGYEFPKIETIKPSNTLVIEAYNDQQVSEVKTVIRLKDFKVKGNANFNKRTQMKRYRDISYVYENYENDKLAVVFSATESSYNYKLDEYTELKDKGFNILYLYDNHDIVGKSFIQGNSASTIESDILTVINKIMSKYQFTNKNVYIFGRSKGGFAALYYSLGSGFDNVYVSTPLFLIGDYYERHERFSPIVNSLGFKHKNTLRYYLNDYFSNINDFSKIKNLNICVGENDYNKQKHTDYLIKWLEEKNIDYSLTIYPGAEFSNDKEEFIKFIKNHSFE